MIYLIVSGDYMKIGYTENPKTLISRMNAYSTHNPYFFLVGICLEGTKEEEQQWHTKYKHIYNEFGKVDATLIREFMNRQDFYVNLLDVLCKKYGTYLERHIESDDILCHEIYDLTRDKHTNADLDPLQRFYTYRLNEEQDECLDSFRRLRSFVRLGVESIDKDSLKILDKLCDK